MQLKYHIISYAVTAAIGIIIGIASYKYFVPQKLKIVKQDPIVITEHVLSSTTSNDVKANKATSSGFKMKVKTKGEAEIIIEGNKTDKVEKVESKKEVSTIVTKVKPDTSKLSLIDPPKKYKVGIFYNLKDKSYEAFVGRRFYSTPFTVTLGYNYKRKEITLGVVYEF